MSKSLLSLSLFPFLPVIAYNTWSVTNVANVFIELVETLVYSEP